MTPTPGETERKLRQHDADIEEIYDALARIQTVQGEHTTQLGTLAQRLDGHDTQLRSIDQRLDGIDTRFEGVDAQLTQVGTQLGEVLELLRSDRG